jgi:hypothetical protein
LYAQLLQSQDAPSLQFLLLKLHEQWNIDLTLLLQFAPATYLHLINSNCFPPSTSPTTAMLSQDLPDASQLSDFLKQLEAVCSFMHKVYQNIHVQRQEHIKNYQNGQPKKIDNELIQVLVVGGGPVGLMSALEAHSKGLLFQLQLQVPIHVYRCTCGSD